MSMYKKGREAAYEITKSNFDNPELQPVEKLGFYKGYDEANKSVTRMLIFIEKKLVDKSLTIGDPKNRIESNIILIKEIIKVLKER